MTVTRPTRLVRTGPLEFFFFSSSPEPSLEASCLVSLVEAPAAAVLVDVALAVVPRVEVELPPLTLAFWLSTWADTPEVYDPSTNTWTLLSNVSTSQVHEQEYPFSYLIPNGKAVHFTLVHAFSNTVHGVNALEAPGQQQINLKMHQWEYEIGYSLGF